MFCFVVLHYLVFDETVKSVDNILKVVNGKKKIIIVDNGSPNDSGVKLQKYYEKEKDVKIIISEKNLGFANGNNLGYKYAVEQFNPEYIVIMNNDVEIPQSDFIDRVKTINKKDEYAVIGPNVFSTFSGVHQSPKRLTSLSINEFENTLKEYNFRKNSKIIIPLKCMIKEIKWLKKIAQSLKFKRKRIDYDKVYENVPLHGSCLIFTKSFIEKRNNAFFDGTFMYFESEILDFELNNNNMKSIYCPSLKVLHHHSVSSSKTYKSELRRERFVNNCVYESILNFLNYVKKNSK